MNQPCWFSTFFISIASIAATAAVFFAGSPQYGPISEVWKHISVPALLAISFGLLVVAVSSIRRGSKLYGIENYVIPALLIILTGVPFVFVTLLVAVKLGGVSG